ncbi:hypothetical protein BDP81DRAFT_418330 [Colletotrichum phormii]|uniref:Uncharacterized protein n=1 Tax=Colletotrichum phormii TaxID=359342 RepID=A0AAJ0A2B2_9PEZI|nr:uncharacterized protein BDP81DRAFT_418330 [Colletotrichum phormii]KAK1641223.1 hypothetical protein BDP81DRAFT_418330 [Colletotrichum phormii]
MYPYQTTTDVAPSVLLLLVSAAADEMGRALTLDWTRFVAVDRQSRCNCSLSESQIRPRQPEPLQGQCHRRCRGQG